MTVETQTSSVRLTVPAKPEYVVLSRLALSAVCRLTPLQPEEVADLKLAITEAATAMVRDSSDERLSYEFELAEDRLVLEISGAADGAVSDEEQELGRAIIEATVDEAHYDSGLIRLVKYLEKREQ